MPLLRAINVLPDGIEIVTTVQGTFTLTSDDIPQGTKNAGTLAVHDWLAQRFGTLLGNVGMTASDFTVISVTPLILDGLSIS